MNMKSAKQNTLFLSHMIFTGTLVGFSYRERGDAGTISLLRQKVAPFQIRIFVTDPRTLSALTNSHESLDFYLNENLVKTLVRSNPPAVSWLKTHVVDFLPKVEIKSVIASCGNLGHNEVPLLVSVLKSVHSVLSKLHLGREVKVSVAFPVPFLEKWKDSHENDLHRILSFIKETNSFVMIEDSIDGELSVTERFVQSAIKRAAHAASILPHIDVPLVLTIKIPAIPSSLELAQFSQTVSKHLEATSTKVNGKAIALYAEVRAIEAFEHEEPKREVEEIFPLSRREILSKIHIRRTLDDTTNPPNVVYPTNPTSAAPVITPPDTPTIITVPSSIPAPPTNPAAMPVQVPSTTSVPLPPTNPTNPGTTPITVPGAQPATYYPPPSGAAPVNSIPPPANSNAPATAGQSWCVAKTGAAEAALQSALDYACGMGGADCSQIQQGGSCYNPNSLENHASYAFNSYYQKNPTPTSCDFGGTATLVNVNPSSGSCILPSSSFSFIVNPNAIIANNNYIIISGDRHIRLWYPTFSVKFQRQLSVWRRYLTILRVRKSSRCKYHVLIPFSRSEAFSKFHCTGDIINHWKTQYVPIEIQLFLEDHRRRSSML
ncbi:uncharacterized protein LOC129285192 isoform X2 [Prosopis cineraria]|uniref:uncharacterized protein LOC129285192 isoform X2 n=1 Tax=Prosopis cineraria TaxID=364024 RepID=UPI00240FF227|nr:uncharacterized protein LOC129285192 isoform X2 [Prosopis cineraria]